MADIYDEVVPELNSLYKMFHDLQKTTFRPTFRQKKIDYSIFVDKLEKNYLRAQEINEYLTKSKGVNPLLLEFADNLSKASQLIWLYFIDKSLEHSSGTKQELESATRDTEEIFNMLFKVSRRLTKSAKKIS